MSAQNLYQLRVLLPVPAGDGYDYLCPSDWQAQSGDWVRAPLGKREAIGIIWSEARGDAPPDKLKKAIEILPLPRIHAINRRFVEWVSAYTLTAPGIILKMMLAGSMADKVLQAQASPRVKKDDLLIPPDPDFFQPTLSEDQQATAAVLVALVKDKKYSATLLDGVTGSGKTEVFCEAIAECLRQGQQALVMLPEIAMTAALIDRFAARFGVRPVVWHSGLTEKQRRQNWLAIIEGRARFVLGARSALFLAYPDLGLIVVDEEHEASYKQEEGVIYQGRDMAVARASLGNLPVILSTATPSLETLFNVEKKRYGHLKLASRFGKAVMPQISIVDMRAVKLPATQFISPPLWEILKANQQAGQQSMLFLNRRGYAPLTLCRKCGHRMECPSCSAWLTLHQHSGKLRCHHCGYAARQPNTCPSCQTDSQWAACGPGVERIAEEVKKFLPVARTAILASDTLDGPAEAEELIRQMNAGELDILVGTQIMAKGYHFPNLTFVGIVDADLGLGGGDPRAAERTFQLLQQVSGRSGRAETSGRVMMQSYNPEHPVLQAIAKNDREAFLASELRERESYRLPPFWRVATITVSGIDQKQVIAHAQMIVHHAPQMQDVQILGPAPAPFTLLRGRYRHRILIRTPRGKNLSAVIRDWMAGIKSPSALKIMIDIDPYTFL